jgi:hypothetical protein
LLTKVGAAELVTVRMPMLRVRTAGRAVWKQKPTVLAEEAGAQMLQSRATFTEETVPSARLTASSGPGEN